MPAQIQLGQAPLCETLQRVRSESCWDKSKGSGAGQACRRDTQQAPSGRPILFLVNIHSPLRSQGKADPSERLPCTWDSRVDPGRCEASPAPPTSCRNSTASRPSSLVSTRDILTQVRKPPENFQLE